MRNAGWQGFTLIELSIVLVIIGLIVGGVLTGRELIKAAEVRAQIAQIEKYNTAVNTFRDKYGGLPGDLGVSNVTQFGFTARAGTAGRGDGNGVIEGVHYSNGNIYGWVTEGEPVFFWQDLSQAKLIDATFSGATDASPLPLTSTTLPNFLPRAKIGNSNYVYVFSTCQSSPSSCFTFSGKNFFGLTSISSINASDVISTPDIGLSVMDAYKIDSKVDDGLPRKGNVQAFYSFANSNPNPGYAPNNATASSSTCFDTTTNTYSITQSGGSNLNCGLSFAFQ